MNKLLITIQGRTLILFYQIKQGLERKGSGWANYIQVLPTAELARFNLKGLTPEMFCVNIADMINIRNMYNGQVENEKQIPVAKWAMNYDEYMQLKNAVTSRLTHKQLVTLLAAMPGYMGESNNQYIEFEEQVVSHKAGEITTYSGYRLTLMTEEFDEDITTRAFYYLDTRTEDGWQDTPPPPADFEPVNNALMSKLQSIRHAGIMISQLNDETDYTLQTD